MNNNNNNNPKELHHTSKVTYYNNYIIVTYVFQNSGKYPSATLYTKICGINEHIIKKKNNNFYIKYQLNI